MIHFVIPLFNKEHTLSENVDRLIDFLRHSLKQSFEVVLCDDGSTDQTFPVARSLAERIPEVRAVGYQRNRGRGYAVRYASQGCSGTHLIFMDLDFPQTTDLKRILEMIEKLRDYQVVIGSRFLGKSETRRIFMRGIIGRVHRVFVRLFFPCLGISDPDMGFKGFQLAGFNMIRGLSLMDRWSWDLEVVIISRANRMSLAELPVDWDERHEKHVSSVRILQDGWEEFRGMCRIKRNLERGLYVSGSAPEEKVS